MLKFHTDDLVIACVTSLLIFVNLHSENTNFKGKKKRMPRLNPLPLAYAMYATINISKLYMAPNFMQGKIEQMLLRH